jgi:outer membrane protein TolC
MVKKVIGLGLLTLLPLFGNDGNVTKSVQEIELDVNGLIKQVVKQNSSLLFEAIEQDVLTQKVAYEKGLFEISGFIDTNFNRTKVPNNTKEALARNSMSTYNEREFAYSFGLNGVGEYGTSYKTYVKTLRRKSNLIDVQGGTTEYESGLYVEVEQPLLKGFGKDITSVKIDLAKLDHAIAKESYKNSISTLIGKTVVSYWKLYGLYEIQTTLEKTYDILKRQHENMSQRVDSGNLAALKLLEMKNKMLAIEIEKSNVIEQINQENSAIAQLLNITSQNQTFRFIPTQAPDLKTIVPTSLASIIERTKANWGELKVIDLEMDKENKNINYLKNSLLPELDLLAKMNTASLDSRHRPASEDALDNDFLNWYIGLELTVPLQGNQQAQSLLTQSVLKLRQLKIKYQSVSNNLVNALRLSWDNFHVTKNKLEKLQESVSVQNVIYKEATNQFEYGKITFKDFF